MDREQKSVRNYTIYALIGTIAEESLLLIILIFVLPYFKISLPWWLIVIIMVFSLAFSYFTYYMGKKALKNKVISGTEAIIGCTGRVISPLNPTGYIKIKGEVWKASCDQEIDVDEEVIVTSIRGFILNVTAAPKNRHPNN